MKFVYADSLDQVDPDYNFLQDRFGPNREPYWTDLYAHELLDEPPYDGLLVSRPIVGDFRKSGKYSESQAMRFRREGARAFLRYPESSYPGSMIMGDCGAFSYRAAEVPPYTPSEIVEFYSDGRFSHGCSVDHIIFDFYETGGFPPGSDDQMVENRRRFEITLKNASDFLGASRRLGNSFTPIGVIQGWSPDSMADAARRLVKMGYDYLAVGGMVPLRAPQIKKALRAIRDAIGNGPRLHILGFAKAEQISEFLEFRLASFDSTSPLIRAFKDARNNYYVSKEEGGLDYYAAIRVPQAIENNRLKDLAKAGIYRQEDLQMREAQALKVLRDMDCGVAAPDQALDAVMEYAAPLTIGRDDSHNDDEQRTLDNLRAQYTRTLNDQPWKACDCAICRNVGIEAVIFRASNRNKRRGMHNLHAYRRHLARLNGADRNG